MANGVSVTPFLSVQVEDANNDQLDVEFFYVLENVSYPIETVYNVNSESRASIAFYSTIQGRNAVYTYLGTGYDYICEWYVDVSDQYTKTSSLGYDNSRWIFITMSVPDDNEKPIADIGGPYEEYENNETILFDGSNCNDSDGEIIFYRWIFGDGDTVTNVKSPYHVYENPGIYNVSLVVIDNNGSSDTDTYTISILAEQTVKEKPIAKPGGPYSARAKTSIKFNASGSKDNDGMIVSYTWDFGDGETGEGVETTHSYTSPGDFVAKLTVEDDDGLTHTRSVAVTITKPPAKKKDSPGFESIAILFVIALFLFFKKYKAVKK